MNEIEVDVFSAEMSQLLFKNIADAFLGAEVHFHPDREFRSDVIAVARIAAECFSHERLGFSLMVHISGVIVIDAVLVSIVAVSYTHLDVYKRQS